MWRMVEAVVVMRMEVRRRVRRRSSLEGTSLKGTVRQLEAEKADRAAERKAGESRTGPTGGEVMEEEEEGLEQLHTSEAPTSSREGRYASEADDCTGTATSPFTRLHTNREEEVLEEGERVATSGVLW